MNSHDAHFHNGNAWVPGVLSFDFQIKEPRFRFVATDQRMLPKTKRIKSEGRVEGFVHKITYGSVVDHRSYRPHAGKRILIIADTKDREAMEPHLCVFAVDDPPLAISQVKTHRDASR
jgi:hypothetical protein